MDRWDRSLACQSQTRRPQNRDGWKPRGNSRPMQKPKLNCVAKFFSLRRKVPFNEVVGEWNSVTCGIGPIKSSSTTSVRQPERGVHAASVFDRHETLFFQR